MWSMAALASSDLGYLPRVGPVPLRLASVARIYTNHFVLPEPVAVVQPVPVVHKVEKPAPPHALPPVELPAVATETNNGAGHVFPEPSPDGVVSPQMFLKFFNKPTVGTTNIDAPADFTPPKPVLPSPGGNAATLKTP